MSAQRRPLRRPFVFVGIMTVLISVIGTVLSVGTILSPGSLPSRVIQQVRERHGAMLASKGLPDGIVQLVRTGAPIPEERVAALSEDDAAALELTRPSLSGTMQASTDAAEKSRSKSQIGAGVSLAVIQEPGQTPASLTASSNPVFS